MTILEIALPIVAWLAVAAAYMLIRRATARYSRFRTPPLSDAHHLTDAELVAITDEQLAEERGRGQ